MPEKSHATLRLASNPLSFWTTKCLTFVKSNEIEKIKLAMPRVACSHTGRLPQRTINYYRRDNRWESRVLMAPQNPNFEPREAINCPGLRTLVASRLTFF